MGKIQDEQQLRDLISGGESWTVELKIAPPRPAELAERLCGLANAQGGWLILGVEDTTLELRGVKDTVEATDILYRAARLCQPQLVFDPPEPQIFKLDTKNIIVAAVPPNKGSIYQSGGVFWVRRGTHTIPYSLDEISEQLYTRGILRWELRPAEGATLEDLDPAQIDNFLARRTAQGIDNPSRRFRSREEVLVGLKCAIKQGDEYLPTNAGLLFFGYNPQEFILQSGVTCVLYGDTLGVKPYIDRKIMRGSLPIIITSIENWLKQHIPETKHMEGFRRNDVAQFPEQALREAIVNAVIHRDYSRVGESVRLFYYPDRIEVHSPGLLLPGITLEMLASGTAPSRLRNAVIAGLLRDIPGYVEAIGSGVKLMIYEMQEHNLPAPEFKELSEFIVTFRSIPEVATNEVNTTYPQPLVIATPQPQITPAIPNPALYADLEERLKVAMQHVHQNGSITNREYRAITSVSESTSMRDLEQLVERGSLRAVGQKRARRYILP